MQNIYIGDRGVMVEYLQLALNRAGYDTPIDGIFAMDTCRQLKRFLHDNEKEGAGCYVDTLIWRQLIPYLRGYDSYGKLFSFDLVSDKVAYTSFLTDLIIEGLINRYPFINSCNVGMSVMGKNISCIKLGQGEKEIFYNASFHANEWITTPVLLKFAQEYAKAYESGSSLYGADINELYEEYSLYLVPMVNPDGVNLVNGALYNQTYFQQAKAIAENFPDIPFPSGWKANINGIDLNLQFPAGWEMAKEIKYEQGYTIPAPRDYVGQKPLSAPESKSIYDFTLSHDFRLIIAYHTQGEVIYWKYSDYEPENSQSIAEYFGKVSGYEVEETPLVSGYAGYKDWFIQQYDRPGYTIEVGLGINPIGMEQFNTIYEQNKEILVGGMTQIK